MKQDEVRESKGCMYAVLKIAVVFLGVWILFKYEQFDALFLIFLVSCFAWHWSNMHAEYKQRFSAYEKSRYKSCESLNSKNKHKPQTQ